MSDRALPKEYVDLFCYLYKDRYGQSYQVPKTKFKKYCGQFKNLQRTYCDETISEALAEYFIQLGTRIPHSLRDPMDLFVTSIASLVGKLSDDKRRDAKGRSETAYERLEEARKRSGTTS